MKNPRLSNLAEFDDMARFLRGLVGGDSLEERVCELLASCETQRLLWLVEHKELQVAREQIKKLKSENRSLEVTLKNVREAFQKELNQREKLQRDNQTLLRKVHVVGAFLEEDMKVYKTAEKEKVLSSLNLHKLQPVTEESSSCSDKSLSGIDFDRTDENLFDDKKRLSEKHEFEKRLSNVFIKSSEFDLPFQSSLLTLPGVIKPKSYSMQTQISADTDVESHGDGSSNEPMECDQLEPFAKSTPNLQCQSMSAVHSKLSTQPLLNQRVPHDFSLIDNRQHKFVLKKIFKPGEKCGPCGKNIGFCNSCFTCRDCRALCHINCKDRVPVPCIPHVPQTGLGKPGRLQLISDYTQPNSTPCVPPLIIDCTRELESRCLNELGLYRVPGSEAQVKELKDKMLKSTKAGVPSLANVDAYVLCGVIKSFLRQLDSALIPRVAWRDFVKAATKGTPIERRIYLEEAISDLPVANRHTLAHLALHLQRVAQSSPCKMPINNLAKVLGPTVVGYSMADLPPMRIMDEHTLCMQVMEQLLLLDASYWRSVISSSSAPKLDEPMDTSQMLQPPTRLAHQTSGTSNSTLGTRLRGGRISIGTISPLKPVRKARFAKEVKPLF